VVVAGGAAARAGARRERERARASSAVLATPSRQSSPPALIFPGRSGSLGPAPGLRSTARALPAVSDGSMAVGVPIPVSFSVSYSSSDVLRVGCIKCMRGIDKGVV
jgi:hypothetical protein